MSVLIGVSSYEGLCQQVGCSLTKEELAPSSSPSSSFSSVCD